ncbi:TPA_asm: hypothetical protein, partial [Powellomyces chytrid fungus MELD virus 2]
TEIALTSIRNKREINDILARTESARDALVQVQAHSPFANVRHARKPYARKQLGAPSQKERAVLKTVDAAQERIALGPAEPSREIQLDTINPPVTLKSGTKRAVSYDDENNASPSDSAKRPKRGDLPEAFKLNPSVKRVALAGAPGRPKTHKKQRTDADVTEITLADVQKVQKRRRGRNINAEIEAIAMIDPRPKPSRTTSETLGYLRPIAKLRGQDPIDYAVPPQFSVNPGEPAISLRKQRAPPADQIKPAKQQKV